MACKLCVYVFQRGDYVCNTNSNSDGSVVCFLFSQTIQSIGTSI